jgi:hypothetical protein
LSRKVSRGQGTLGGSSEQTSEPDLLGSSPGSYG